MSAPQSSEIWIEKDQLVQYCAVVFQPNSLNDLYVLMNHNLTILLYDLMRHTSSEYVDSYIVGVPKDENHFDHTLDEMYEEVNEQPDRFVYWRLKEKLNKETNYQEKLDLWKRLAEQIDPNVTIELNGIQRTLNPEDKVTIQIHGSRILNLSSHPVGKLENP